MKEKSKSSNNMKKLVAVIVISMIPLLGLYAQQAPLLDGAWGGVLDINGYKLRLILNVTSAANGYTATLDSPDQGAKGIPVNEITFKNDSLRFSNISIRAVYTGKYEEDSTINGIFEQMGNKFPLKLKKINGELEAITRLQDPKKPYPYLEEEVSFENKKAGIQLVGSFTKPSTGNSFPVVLLISGSGPQDRNENMLNHKPFLIIADYLTRNGVAVLRVDDRGTGKSKGVYAKATSLDLADDALSGVEYLKQRKDINPKKIGLIGHSEGGMIAPMVAAKSKDVAFIVMMAGIGISGDQLLLTQIEEIYRKSGATQEEIMAILDWNKKAHQLVKTAKDTVKLKAELIQLGLEQKNWDETRKTRLGVSDASVQMQLNFISSPWMKYFLTFDPKPVLKQVKVPVLAINGSKDVQVLADINLKGIEEGLRAGGNKKFEIKKLDGLNHLFQKAISGLMTEYGQIEETIEPSVLELIGNWVLKQ